MMGQLKKFSLQMTGGANIASIIVMLLIGYSGFINPVSFPRLSNIGLLFPIISSYQPYFSYFVAYYQAKVQHYTIVGLCCLLWTGTNLLPY